MIMANLYFVAKKYEGEDPEIFLGPCLTYEEAEVAREIWNKKNYSIADIIIMKTEVRLEQCKVKHPDKRKKQP